MRTFSLHYILSSLCKFDLLNLKLILGGDLNLVNSQYLKKSFIFTPLNVLETFLHFRLSCCCLNSMYNSGLFFMNELQVYCPLLKTTHAFCNHLILENT